jgi:ATP-binding cassette, subfamily B, bacterial
MRFGVLSLVRISLLLYVMIKGTSFEVRKQAAESQARRDRISAIRYIFPLLKLVWDTNRVYVVVVVALRLVRSFTPVAALWVGKLIIDAVITMRGVGGNTSQLWKLIVLEAAIVGTGDVVARALAVMEALLADLFNNYTSIKLMSHAATLDLYHFEAPEFYDRLERARQQTSMRLGLLAQILSIGQDLLTLITLGAALFVFKPWLLALLTVAVIPGFFAEKRFAVHEYSLFRLWTPARRRLDYLRYVGASNATAKEVQMFGLSPWLTARFRRLAQKFFAENKRLSIRRSLVGSGLSLVSTLGYYAAYVQILIAALDGSITIGAMTFLSGSFMRMRDLVQRLLTAASGVYQQALYLKDLFDFFDLKPSITSRPGAPPAPRSLSEGVVFEDVGFRYPGSDKWAVRHMSFRLRPGERVALVGENGAGKTTLAKLLARLYDPGEGRILLDGKDLREYDLISVRQMIGVIFQDFVRYDWCFDENIGVGEIDAVKSYLDSLEELKTVNGKRRFGKARLETVTAEPLPIPFPIVSAAEKSLASTLLPRFSEGYRQMLGRRFDHGIELSGGEWQKIALARAYIRDARVLILDEPTAALDARAEYEVFKGFSQLVTGRTAVIISHRFSTVRMADRIIVLQNGAVIEEGAHADLIAGGGLYAKLFALQAQGYQ